MQSYDSIITKSNNKEKEKLILTDDYFHIIEHALDIKDIIDLKKEKYGFEYPDFKFDTPYPQKQHPKKKNFILDLLDIGKMSEQESINKKYVMDCDNYINSKKLALKKYLYDKKIFEDKREQNNTDLDYLRYYYEKSEKSAVEKYCSLILDNSEYPKGLEHEYQIVYNYTLDTLMVDLLLPSLSDFPNPPVMKEKDDAKSHEIDEIEYKEIYEKVMISIGLRTIKELFKLNYNPKIKNIIFNAFVLRDYIEYSKNNPDFTNYSRCLYGIKTNREEFSKYELTDRNVLRMSEKMKLVRIKNFNDFTEVMAPIKLRQE